jgi:hypothetical protein
LQPLWRWFGGLEEQIDARGDLLDGDLEHLAAGAQAFADGDAAVVLEGVDAPSGVLIPEGVVDG